jgi:hypothetical protein
MTVSYRERAEKVLNDMSRREAGAQDRQAMAAEAQVWASLAIADAISSAASSLPSDLRQVLDVLAAPK